MNCKECRAKLRCTKCGKVICSQTKYAILEKNPFFCNHNETQNRTECEECIKGEVKDV